MIRMVLLFLALPAGGILAQRPALHLLITSPNREEFRIVRSTADSAERPIFGRGRLDLIVSDSGALQKTEVVATDAATRLQIEAVQNGRVIATCDCPYLMIRSDGADVVIEARNAVPATVTRDPRRP